MVMAVLAVITNAVLCLKCWWRKGGK